MGARDIYEEGKVNYQSADNININGNFSCYMGG